MYSKCVGLNFVLTIFGSVATGLMAALVMAISLSPALAQTRSQASSSKDLATAINKAIDFKLNRQTPSGPVSIISLSSNGARTLIARGLVQDFNSVHEATQAGKSILFSTEGQSDDCSPSAERGDKLYYCVYARNERALFSVRLGRSNPECVESGSVNFTVRYIGFSNRIWTNLVSQSGRGLATYTCSAGYFMITNIPFFRWTV